MWAPLRLSSVITGDGNIRCELYSQLSHRITQPLLCFSLLAPAIGVCNCEVVSHTGGFTELRLKEALQPGKKITFVIGYREPEFKAANRAWLPLGCYLKNNDEIFPVATAAGGLPRESPVTTSNTHAGQFTEAMMVPKPVSVALNGDSQSIETVAVNAAEKLTSVALHVDALAQRNGFKPLVSSSGMPAKISIEPSLSESAYGIEIARGNILISAADESGVFYALVTLLTLRETGGGTIQEGIIKDEPRFEWRGQHLDCARHYYQVDTILRLLDLMALLKLNRFHWHICDDEAFRLQTDFAASLWQQTAYRGEGELISGVFGGGAGSYGGSYSKDDVTQILARAKALYIEVMPEVEFPAHAFCINQSVNGLRDPEDFGLEESVQGYRNNVVNPALPETMAFFTGLCKEVAASFPFSHIHLGGDELPEGSWLGSPVMNNYKIQHGLANAEDVEGFAMHKLAAEMRTEGIIPCAWEESGRGVNGGIGNDAILFLWQGLEQFQQLASQGYRCVLTPAQHTYFDMAHTDQTSDWGANWAATIRLADTINWEPLPAALDAYADNCLGVQGAFWSEFTTTDSEMEAMIAPRILGLACKAWCGRGAVTSAELLSMAQAYEAIFQKMQWQTAPMELYT